MLDLVRLLYLSIAAQSVTKTSSLPGAAFVLNTVSWVFGVLTTIGVIITGISANKGHRWAAGNRAYRPIAG